MTNRARGVSLLVLSLCLKDFSICFAQVNSWTNSASGRWEDVLSWSLGVLPGTNQAILLTNEGSKTIEIRRRTAQKYPESLAVDTITLSSAPGSSNALVLQHTGDTTPLRVNYLTIASNAAMIVRSSALEVAYQFEIDGTFVQENSAVTSGFVNVGFESPATYELNSGTLSSRISYEAIGGREFPCQFIQRGGTNQGTAISLRTNGTYELTGGVLAAPLTIRAGANFIQRGGLVDDSGGGLLINGNFFQSGGTFIGPTNDTTYIPSARLAFDVSTSVFAVQTGGTNRQSSFFIGNPSPPEVPDPSGGCHGLSPYSGSYVLSNGVLVSSGTTVGPNGTLDQMGGLHLTRELSVQGAITYYGIHHTTNVSVGCARPANYRLRNGLAVINGDVYVEVAGTIVQDGGTNIITGRLFFGSSRTGAYPGSYALDGGTLIVSNLLLPSREDWSQSGGVLVAGDLQIFGTGFQQSGGTVNQSGLLTLNKASVTVAGGEQHFGQVQPDAQTSSLLLPSDPCTIRFGDSSAVAWPPEASLRILNWSGSLHGGGRQRIVFGASAGALSAQQLSQVVFVNPPGVPSGSYSAKILSTGEIVPDAGAPLPPIVTLLSVRQTGAKLLQLDADPGQYAIEVSTDLLHWLPWTTQFNADGTIIIEDADAVNWSQRFYRARLIQ